MMHLHRGTTTIHYAIRGRLLRDQLTISLKKNILGHNSTTPCISIGGYTLEIVDNFTYLDSNISNKLCMDVELNVQIGKAATVMAYQH